MRRHLLRATCALAIIMFNGACAYESAVPLGPATAAEPDPDLAGVYVLLPEHPSDAAPDTVRIRPFNDREYLVTAAQGSHAAYIRAFITRVAGVPVVNLQELEAAGPVGESRPFLFARYAWDGDILEVRLISDRIREKFTSSAALRAWLEPRIGDPATWDDRFRLRRVAPDPRG